VTALLGEVGGRKVYGDALGRQRETNGIKRPAHALPALGDRLVGQPDDGESRHPGADLYLHIDRAGLDTLERHRCNPRKHSRTPV